MASDSHFLQYRPIGTNEPAYNPERDIAWTFAALCHNNIPPALSPGNLPAWLAPHLREHGVTDQRLQRAIDAFLQGVENCRDPEIPGAKEALTASGFWDVPDSDKVPVFTALGMILFSYYFKAVREATLRPDSTIPKLCLATPQTVDAIAAGRPMVEKQGFWKRWLQTKEGRRLLGK